jgi:hypothetical protein
MGSRVLLAGAEVGLLLLLDKGHHPDDYDQSFGERMLFVVILFEEVLLSINDNEGRGQ